MVLCGVGLGPSTPLFTLAIQNAVPRKDLGQATSASQFFRQIGASLGGALLGAIMGASLGGFLAANLPTGSSSMTAELIPGISEESIMQRGGTDVMEQTAAAYIELYLQVEGAIAKGDQSALKDLAQHPLMPVDLQTVLATEEMAMLDLPAIDSGLQQAAKERGEHIQEIVREGFSQAITGIYRITLIMVALSILVTLFVPEIPLRRTNDPAPMEGIG
jgi:hypothetical protein